MLCSRRFFAVDQIKANLNHRKSEEVQCFLTLAFLSTDIAKKASLSLSSSRLYLSIGKNVPPLFLIGA